MLCKRGFGFSTDTRTKKMLEYNFLMQILVTKNFLKSFCPVSITKLNFVSSIQLCTNLKTSKNFFTKQLHPECLLELLRGKQSMKMPKPQKLCLVSVSWGSTLIVRLTEKQTVKIFLRAASKKICKMKDDIKTSENNILRTLNSGS